MIIIAFSRKTSKILPRLFCRHFRHCAPIIIDNAKPYMLQFTKPGRIYKIYISADAIRKLGAYGWQFIYIPGNLPNDFCAADAYSCVDLSKRALRLRTMRIQTPDGLYKYLCRRQ